MIEPQSLNDARLFALESRLHKEEEIRVEEYDYMKDMLKKLVYSLEQDVKVIKSSRDPNSKNDRESDPWNRREKQINSDLAFKTQTEKISLKLPDVNRSITPAPDDDDLDEPNYRKVDEKTNVMLRRLNFIMASLDGHNAFRYTEQNREEAEFDKHKRVWELWK